MEKKSADFQILIIVNALLFLFAIPALSQLYAVIIYTLIFILSIIIAYQLFKVSNIAPSIFFAVLGLMFNPFFAVSFELNTFPAINIIVAVFVFIVGTAFLKLTQMQFIKLGTIFLGFIAAILLILFYINFFPKTSTGRTELVWRSI